LRVTAWLIEDQLHSAPARVTAEFVTIPPVPARGGLAGSRERHVELVGSEKEASPSAHPSRRKVDDDPEVAVRLRSIADVLDGHPSPRCEALSGDDGGWHGLGTGVGTGVAETVGRRSARPRSRAAGRCRLQCRVRSRAARRGKVAAVFAASAAGRAPVYHQAHRHDQHARVRGRKDDVAAPGWRARRRTRWGGRPVARRRLHLAGVRPAQRRSPSCRVWRPGLPGLDRDRERVGGRLGDRRRFEGRYSRPRGRSWALDAVAPSSRDGAAGGWRAASSISTADPSRTKCAAEQPRRLGRLHAVTRPRHGDQSLPVLVVGAAHERQAQRDWSRSARSGSPDRLRRSRHPGDQRIDEKIGGGVLAGRASVARHLSVAAATWRSAGSGWY